MFASQISWACLASVPVQDKTHQTSMLGVHVEPSLALGAALRPRPSTVTLTCLQSQRSPQTKF